MSKLELKHLAPYLPYKLQIQHNSEVSRANRNDPLTPFTKTMEGLTLNLFCLENSDEYEFEYKPILRPLSDLTNFVTIYGKSQIFMECYFQISAQEEADFYSAKEVIPEYWALNIKMLKNGDYGHLDYWIVEKLFEWHFDVFGLIEKGLAINIDTLDYE